MSYLRQSFCLSAPFLLSCSVILLSLYHFILKCVTVILLIHLVNCFFLVGRSVVTCVTYVFAGWYTCSTELPACGGFVQVLDEGRRTDSSTDSASPAGSGLRLYNSAHLVRVITAINKWNHKFGCLHRHKTQHWHRAKNRV